MKIRELEKIVVNHKYVGQSKDFFVEELDYEFIGHEEDGAEYGRIRNFEKSEWLDFDVTEDAISAAWILVWFDEDNICYEYQPED